MVELVRLEADALETVLELDAICFAQEPFAAGWWHKAIAGEGAECWLLYRQGRLQGYCLFSWVLDEAELLRIAVAPDQRGKGLATALLLHAQQALRKQGVVQLFLEVRVSNCSAHALYQRCGWQNCGIRKEYYPLDAGREDALLFSRQI
jgi:ribosomal-protein-alanine N-acetyltransferase